MRKGPRKASKKAPLGRKKAPRSDPPADSAPEPIPDREALLESPYAIIDSAVADAARTIMGVANGTLTDVSREQLSAAQDILNRKGITSAGNKNNVIPEAFARDAFSTVFRLLGFPPIKWPRISQTQSAKENEDNADVDDFNRALLEN